VHHTSLIAFHLYTYFPVFHSQTTISIQHWSKSCQPLPETKVPASTVDKNSARSPSDTGRCFCDASDQSAGTGGPFLRDFDFESYDGKPVEEFKWTYHECVSPGTVQALEKIWPGETPAGQATVGDNRSEWGGGEQEVKTELPCAVSISDNCVTHFARTENTRDSNSRPVRGRYEQSGVTGSRVGKANAETRSQTAERRKGRSLKVEEAAVKLEGETGQVWVKQEES
jgi:hypothetical protein